MTTNVPLLRTPARRGSSMSYYYYYYYYYYCYVYNNNKKGGRLCMKLFPTPIHVSRCASMSYFEMNALFFCCPLFFEEHLNLQVRINKIVKKPPGQDQQNSKQWQLPSWYSKNNFKDTFSHICIILLRALSQSGIVEFSVEPIYPNMGNFSNSWYSDYWKVHLQGKKLNLGIYQTAAKQNSPTGSYRTLKQREITQPWMQIFFENLFSSQQKGEQIMWYLRTSFLI